MRVNVRAPAQSNQSTQSTHSHKFGPADRTLDRVHALASQIKETLLDDARAGETGNGTGSQVSIDRALTEIASLLGSKLELGGAKNAVIKGLNSKQIVNVEVLSLPPGASARFSGALNRNARVESAVIRETNNLLQGGTLEFDFGRRKEFIKVRRGSSLASVVREVNARNLGVRARANGKRLKLLAAKRNRNSSLEVAVRQPSRSAGHQVSGQNVAQIADIDVRDMKNGQSAVIQGTRDTLATFAELTYQGDGSGLANGSVTFDLTGRLGTANLNVVEGETLSQLASRINAASPSTGAIAEVINNELFVRSDTKGDLAQVRISNVVHQYEQSVEGVNASQFDTFDLVSIPDDSEVTLTGSVTVAADTANLTYQGGAGGGVVDSATFTLTGNGGSAQISISQNESLGDVRDRINAESETTGIVASISGDNLVFSSQDVGSAQSVNVTLDQVTQYANVDGVDADQLGNFNVVSSEPSSINTLSGEVTEAATQGELTYRGKNGKTKDAAEFTLTGELGSTTIVVADKQSLSSVRDSINAVSATTGVTASKSGSKLFLTSQNYGSAGIVQVDVLSGTFNTSGGDGDGNAAGLDAELEINGNAVTANGNQVSYSDALGSYTFEIAEEFSGEFDPVTITTSDGEFDVTGGNGQGTAFGVDAEVTINGQDFVAVGNDFQITVDQADVAFATAAGFSGTIDPITLRSTPSDFQIQGGDANGLATGLDGTATINGTTYSSINDTFEMDVDGSDVTIEFGENYLGAFDEISILALKAPGRTSPPRGLRGSDLGNVAAINGRTVSASKDRYIVEQDGVRLALKFAKGFSGQFDPFTVSAGGTVDSAPARSNLTPLVGRARQSTLQALSDLFQLASGGARANNTVDSLSISVKVLGNLKRLAGESPARGRSLKGFILDELA